MLQPLLIPEIIIPLLVVLGAAFGSFFNVCICRIPEGKSIAFPPSACPQCGNKILPWHNIPLFSFLFLKGKCAYCGKKISWLYPLVEFLTPLIYLSLYFHFGLTLIFLKYAVFCSFGIIIFFIDAKHKMIYHATSIPLIITGLVFALLPGIDYPEPSFVGSLIGGATAFVVFFGISYLYQKLKNSEGLGGGDVMLVTALGTYLGLIGFVFSIMIGSFLALTFILLHRKYLKEHLPYGPFLLLGAYLYIMVGPNLVKWYLWMMRV